MVRQPKTKFAEERIEKYDPITPLNEKQAKYIKALNTAEQILVFGPAGVGKTYISSALAADGMRVNKWDKIILTRPNVPAGRSLGAVPGDLDEKFEAWARPFTDVIRSRMTVGAYEIAVKKKHIETVPFEVMRGRTFSDAFVILDEAQNCTIAEMKMFLTRIGENTKVVINGDLSQSDIKEKSGLKMMIDLAQKYKIPVAIVEFDILDVVRSDLCSQWVTAFFKEKI